MALTLVECLRRMPPRRAASRSVAELFGYASPAREAPAEERPEASDNQDVMLELMREVVGLVRNQRQNQAPAPPPPPPPSGGRTQGKDHYGIQEIWTTTI